VPASGGRRACRLLLLIVLACAGMWWPLLAATALFLVFWGLASLLWRAVFGPRHPPAVEPSLETLCAQERRIQERAQGFRLDNGYQNHGLYADTRSRLAPR
jgi:hypothetical protein